MTTNISATEHAMARVPAPIQRFLEGIQTANWTGIEDCFTPDAIYDASVPGWHFQYQGAARIARELREEWTGKHPWRIVELNVALTAEGAVVDLEARGHCPGDEHHAPHKDGARLANIFRLDGDRIAEHRFFCCGEWDEETMRRIDAEAPRVRRTAGAG